MLYELAVYETVCIRTPVLVEADSPEEAIRKINEKDGVVWVKEEEELVNCIDFQYDPEMAPRDVSDNEDNRKYYDDALLGPLEKRP